MSEETDKRRSFRALAIVVAVVGLVFLLTGNIVSGVLTLLFAGLFLKKSSTKSSADPERQDPFGRRSGLNDRKERRLSFEDYARLVRELPLPSGQQMQEFAEFVSHAHSWYKHLTLLPPGAPFQFFLDPSAGMQREISADGQLRISPRTESGFHYSWIPTDEYRDRFGHLAYSRSAGTSVSLVGSGRRLVPSDDEPVIYDSELQRLASLPRSVLEAGGARVSGIVHTLSAAYPGWWLNYEANGVLRNWPEESGGQASVERIVGRCRQLVDSPSDEERLDFSDPRAMNNMHLSFVDYPLHEALQPERMRQLTGMVEAMRRVVQLTHD